MEVHPVIAPPTHCLEFSERGARQTSCTEMELGVSRAEVCRESTGEERSSLSLKDIERMERQASLGENIYKICI